jgi:hypothetical protein
MRLEKLRDTAASLILEYLLEDLLP